MNGPIFDEIAQQRFQSDSFDPFFVNVFMSWASRFNKSYADKETFEKRLEIFSQNFQKVKEIMDEEHGSFMSNDDMHEVEMNQFGDWSDEEYSQMLSFKPDLALNASKTYESLPVEDLPDSIDWVTQGMVSPVKDQGHCGSCWSFSTTGSMESAYQIATGKAVLLSE